MSRLFSSSLTTHHNFINSASLYFHRLYITYRTMVPWNAAKAKVQLRISVQRIRTLQQKKEAQAKMSRREIALLLERGKIETARVKGEAIINDDIHVELLELMELYCELLLARFGLLDQNNQEPDPAIREGICAVIFAATRTEIKELQALRDIVMHKYGRDFSAAVMENRDDMVPDRVVKRLVIATPSPELVDAYLHEIAKAYSVNWVPPGHVISLDIDEAEEKKEDLPKEKSPIKDDDAPKLPDVPPAEKKSAPPEDDFDALTRRFNELKKRG